MLILQLLVSGLLFGLVLALIAIGLSLIYGVVGLVNFAHGDFVMCGMYITYTLFLLFGFSPLVSLPITALLMFAFGICIYRVLISKVLKGPMVAQMFATFAVGMLLRGVMQFIFGTDYLSVKTTLSSSSFNIGGITINTAEMIAGVAAIICTAFIFWMLKRTNLGRCIEATAQNKFAATLMGINTEKMFMIVMGIGSGCVGVAAALLSNYYYIFPDVGAIFGTTSFIVVAMGGFGSIQGAFIAGIIMGIVEMFSGFFLPSEYKLAIVSLIYFVFVIIRPQGIMGSTVQ